MFHVYELNAKILSYLDIKSLKNICFLNKQVVNILFYDKQFWLDNFDYDNLPILDNPPCFQEYIKINKYKNLAEKILIINDIEYHDKNHQSDGTIVISLKQDIDLLGKILPNIVDDIKKIKVGLNKFYLSIFLSPAITDEFYIHSDEVKVILYDPNLDENHNTFNSCTYNEIVDILIKCLYYNIDIHDNSSTEGISFTREYVNSYSGYEIEIKSVINNRLIQYHTLTYLGEEIIRPHLDKLKYHIDKKYRKGYKNITHVRG